MTEASDAFAHLVGDMREFKDLPWGRLQYGTARMNIARYLGEPPRRVLDVGGGNGENSIHYAGLGHDVTLFDGSESMIEAAMKLAEEQGASDRLTVQQGIADMIQELLDGQEFHLILCHLMIEMVTDPYDLLRQMCNLLAPGGFLSVLDANRYSEPFIEAITKKDLAGAVEAVGATAAHNRWAGRVVPRFAAQELIDRLKPNGCSLAGHYGVCSISHWLPNEPKFDPEYFATLEELEYRLTDEYPYYLLARFFQIIARKD